MSIIIRVKSELLSLLRSVPSGRVTTTEALGYRIGVSPPLVQSLLAHLTEEERDYVPWHRVVAKGGAIGRGPNRDRQFALLIREGVHVSPAGIIHDLTRYLAGDPYSSTPEPADSAGPEKETAGQLSRSRGMKHY
ncbi:cysteine methyltransferase [Hyphomicrobium methylovorum]|uniref:MGMT family protein n=1 Tax=Hyphomicrobium methylovorum TaxID=84 RepID=UPI0015E79BCC|nr:MGMT family protein [Hyphomicrobium methylovorum]MBA2125203.1 cysteine methyltransferase [Hyphomicrobium methylovorum]